jgi:hypothetical protein
MPRHCTRYRRACCNLCDLGPQKSSSCGAIVLCRRCSPESELDQCFNLPMWRGEKLGTSKVGSTPAHKKQHNRSRNQPTSSHVHGNVHRFVCFHCSHDHTHTRAAWIALASDTCICDVLLQMYAKHTHAKRTHWPNIT